MTFKICSKCNIDKDLGEFHKDKSRKDGLRSACKECRNLRNLLKIKNQLVKQKR